MKLQDKKVFVAGHLGMVGSAIVRSLKAKGYSKIIEKSFDELDLTVQADVLDFFEEEKFDLVFLAAAKVGGIFANDTYPAEFIYQNLMIQNNIIHSAHISGVDRLLFLGSSCIYPKMAVQPMSESELLRGTLEPTNEPYAIAKIAGIKLCESYNRQYGRDYRSVMPTNLYGPNDNFHPENSHVIPALVRRIHEAKLNRSPQVEIWGTGRPMREFLYVDDMAEACIHVMELDKDELNKHVDSRQSHINIGSGVDTTIEGLAKEIVDVVGYSGELVFDTSKPDGTPRKLLDVSLARQLGWEAKTSLRKGLEKTYAWFVENNENHR